MEDTFAKTMEMSSVIVVGSIPKHYVSPQNVLAQVETLLFKLNINTAIKE